MSYIYSQAAGVLRTVISRRAGLKSACFAGRVNVKAVYALVQKVLPNYRKLEKEIKKISTSNKFVAIIMLYDFWTTGKISGGGALKKLIIKKFPVAKTLITQKNPSTWVRVNAFNPPSDCSKLGVQDTIIPNLYLATRSKEISELINGFQVIAQSRASCMPVAALNLWKGNWNAVDTCSAPGNKTLQLAENMKKFTTGVLYAYEKDQKRFNLLKERIEAAKADNIIAINQDFFAVTDFYNVKVAVVDPSCSGSGIIEHQIVDNGKIHYNFNFSDARIMKLSEFQLKILDKVLSIRGLDQVVYSTCSVYVMENENVIEKAMGKYWRSFKLEKALWKWNDRGIGRYGKYMARSVPSDNNSQGFFVAKIVKRKLRLRHKLLTRSCKHWILRKNPKYT